VLSSFCCPNTPTDKNEVALLYYYYYYYYPDDRNYCALGFIFIYSRPGQIFADQELILIFTEYRGPPHILIFLVVCGKVQEVYNNNNNNNIFFRTFPHY
jgi:hypothetical protein